jgi:hypothetical protein
MHTLLSDSVVSEVGPALVKDGIRVDSLECPHGMPVQLGFMFDCTLMYDGGKTTRIRVTEIDDRGTFKWTTTVILADRVVAQLKPQVEAQTGKSVQSIDCPDGMPLAVGTSFDCHVSFIDGSSLALFVSQSDAQGNLTWTVRR